MFQYNHLDQVNCQARKQKLKTATTHIIYVDANFGNQYDNTGIRFTCKRQGPEVTYEESIGK